MRLSRVERAVGLFVILATVLFVAGFSYYLYQTAKEKGWFLPRANCHTFLQSAAGIKENDDVFMLGFKVGKVLKVKAMPPFSSVGNVFVKFEVQGENIGYIWNDSKVKVATADFLGKRTLELIPGGSSGKKDLKASFIQDKSGNPVQVWNEANQGYITYTNGRGGFWITADESAALGDRLEKMASTAEHALPNILNLTNQLSQVLSNSAQLTAHLDEVAVQTRSAVSNVTVITAQLRNPYGSLGDWLIPTNMNVQLTKTLTNVNQTLARTDTLLTSVNTTVTNTDERLGTLVTNLNTTLENISGITGGLNEQVQSNTNLIKNLSDAIVHADGLVQGLKHHWLLRSAFKTNAPPKKVEKK